MAGLKVEDRWTAEQESLVVSLRSELIPWKEISDRIGRSTDSCFRKYKDLVPHSERKWHASARKWPERDEKLLKKLLREGKKPRHVAEITGWHIKRIYSKIMQMERPGRTFHIDRDVKYEPPPRLLEERDRRQSQERDITAEFFGDPRRGQSALDKKMGVFA